MDTLSYLRQECFIDVKDLQITVIKEPVTLM